MKFWVIVGMGPNEITIPSLIFTSKSKAEKFLENHKIGSLEKFIAGEPIDYSPYYISYYGGCGDCYAFRIKEVEEGVPFVNWNLD